jgi:DNA-binding NarL/FixJ family response regulator
MKNIRVLIADDNPQVLRFLSDLLSDDFCVVGTVSDGRALIAAAVALQPHIIITDIDMPLTGLDAVRQLEALMPDIKVMVLTDHEEPEFAAAALAAGASAFLIKKRGQTYAARSEQSSKTFSPHIPNGSRKRLLPMGMITHRLKEEWSK